MDSHDKPRFLAVINALACMKPGKPLTPEALELYWLSLEGWSLEEFTQAARHLSRSCEFMPNPYHFEQLRKAGQRTAGEAWARVRAILPRVSRYEVTAIDPRIDRVVAAMGGYTALSMTATDQLPWREKRFLELWDELGEADEARVALPSVAGRLAGPQRMFTDARALVQNEALRGDRP